MTELRVDDLGARGAFRALAPAWQELAERQGSAGPFSRPEWFALWAAHLARPPRRLRLLVAHARGRLAGALPLLAERRRLAGVPARVLRSLSDDHSQRFDPPIEGDEALAAIWRHLRADSEWDVIELRDLPAGSPRAAALARLAADDGYLIGWWPSQRSPYLPLPATAAELDDSLATKHRANLRRRRRGLASAAGPVALERIDGGRSIGRALDDGLALESAGWKGRAGTAIAVEPALVARYRALARLLARRGELALHFLTAGGRRVAFHFAAETGGVYYLFKPGYDPSLARHGLGQLLLHEVAHALVARGVREIDLLGDEAPWKRDWTALARAHAWLYLVRPSPLGRLLAAWKLRLLPAVRALARGAG